MVTRAAVYTRISRDDRGDLLGVKRQERDGRALCERKGWEVAMVFVDDDISAWSGKRRPGYSEMLASIEAGDLDAVVAYDLDRLHRLPKELEQFFEICDQAGVKKLATVSGDVDLATNDGRLMARIMGAVAKKSSDDASRRIKRKFDERAEAGLPHGPRAFGYESDGVTVNAREAQLLREALDDVLVGTSLNEIARRWNDLGVLTPQKSRLWSGTVVRAVLLNPRQAGKRVHRGEVVGAGIWEPIVDEAKHERIVAVLTDPARRMRTPPRRTPFTGLVRCKCGKSLQRTKVKRWFSYRCNSAPSRPGCAGVSISAVPLEALLLEAVFTRVDTPAMAKTIAKGRKFPKAALTAETDLADTRARMADLAEMFAAGEINRAEWLKARNRLEERERTARASLASVESETVLTPFVQAPGLLRETWPTLTVDRQRAILSAAIDRVVIGPSTQRGPKFDPGRILDIEWKV